MLIVQFAINAAMRPLSDNPPVGTSPEALSLLWEGLTNVHLGLDIVWDIYLCLGSFLVAWNMRRHPRFGMLFAIPGMVLSAALWVLNVQTFPTPPGEAGLVDLGPVLGFWYLFVAIQMVRSLKWADDRLGSPDD